MSEKLSGLWFKIEEAEIQIEFYPFKFHIQCVHDDIVQKLDSILGIGNNVGEFKVKGSNAQ